MPERHPRALSVLKPACSDASVVFVHAPYPGNIKFSGTPSGLLHASSATLALLDESEARVGYLDPARPSVAFLSELEHLLTAGSCEVLCISTSTAAIDETQRLARLARDIRGDRVRIIVGGPHEDACAVKAAERIPDVDVSLAGPATHVLASLVEGALRDEPAARTLAKLKSPAGSVIATHRQGTEVWQESVAAGARGASPCHRPVLERAERFAALGPGHTNEVMLRTGCSYGRCTFCAEARISRTLSRPLSQVSFLEALAERDPSSSYYFQDSIFPFNDDATRREVLPWLRRNGPPWGCQVYLNTLTRKQVQVLQTYGCRYVYTGVESGSKSVLGSIGKHGFTSERALERLGWLADAGIRVGISLMFGALQPSGKLVEDEATVAATLAFADRIVEFGVPLVGFFPNVQTVLPGTPLASGLAAAGYDLDFYRMPRQPLFAGLEDGGIGYNFTTIPNMSWDWSLASRIAEAAAAVSALRASAC